MSQDGPAVVFDPLASPPCHLIPPFVLHGRRSGSSPSLGPCPRSGVSLKLRAGVG